MKRRHGNNISSIACNTFPPNLVHVIEVSLDLELPLIVISFGPFLCQSEDKISNKTLNACLYLIEVLVFCDSNVN